MDVAWCVLLVDDEPQLTEGLRLTLRQEPFRILTANSAQDALAVLGRETVDVIISDEMMPGMGGTELLALARRRSPNTLRMLLTGQTSLAMLVRAVNEGKICHFFSKPCAAPAIAQVVRQALRLRDLEQKRATVGETSQRQLLRRLELDNPGITEVRRDASGAILMNEDDLETP